MDLIRDKITLLLAQREQVQKQFQQANQVIESCKQKHAEITGGIAALESLLIQVDVEEEVVSSDFGSPNGAAPRRTKAKAK